MSTKGKQYRNYQRGSFSIGKSGIMTFKEIPSYIDSAKMILKHEGITGYKMGKVTDGNDRVFYSVGKKEFTLRTWNDLVDGKLVVTYCITQEYARETKRLRAGRAMYDTSRDVNGSLM